jgi:hypothetical protein
VLAAACSLSCSGGSDGNKASTGGAAGSASSGGAGGTAGTSGVGGASGSGTASAVTTTCEVNEAKLAYDGDRPQSYALGKWPKLYSADMGKASRIYSGFGFGQYEILFEPMLDPASKVLPGSISDAQAWPIRSALFAEAREQTLGPMRCVAPGSGSTLARKDDQLLVDLQQVDVLQTCADHPLDGQINLCFEFEGCDGFDGGSLDGAPWALQPDNWVGGSGSWLIDFADGSYMRARTTGSTTGPAYWALIVTSVNGPYNGQVFCSSGGTIEKVGGDTGYTVMHWANLGAVSCGAGTGTAQGCLKGE